MIIKLIILKVMKRAVSILVKLALKKIQKKKPKVEFFFVISEKLINIKKLSFPDYTFTRILFLNLRNFLILK